MCRDQASLFSASVLHASCQVLSKHRSHVSYVSSTEQCTHWVLRLCLLLEMDPSPGTHCIEQE